MSYLKKSIALEARGVPVRDRLKISPACPLILPHHVQLDLAREEARAARKLVQLGAALGPRMKTKPPDADCV